MTWLKWMLIALGIVVVLLIAIIAALGLADSLAVFVPLLSAMSVTPLRAA